MTTDAEARPPARPEAPADDRLARLIALWQQACADFVALVGEIPQEQWDLPTDLPGWSVKDNVAHTAHLEAVLAGAPEETLDVTETGHLAGPTGYYTEQGILARRDRDMPALVAEIEQSVATRSALMQADPPTDGAAAPPRTLGGAPWNYQTLLSNRPFDVWMHEQDIRRAIGHPGGYDAPAARHVLTTFGRALPMIVGKRLAPPTGTVIRIVIPDAELTWTVGVDDTGRAVAKEDSDSATTTVTLQAEDFVLLAGGRRDPEGITPAVEGDQELGRRLLQSMTITP